jgi:hypothetical protein
MADTKRLKRVHGSGDDRSIESYTQWLKQRGCVLSPGVQVARDENGDSLIATKDLEPGTQIISVPSELLLTTDAAVRSEIGAAVASHPSLRVLNDEELEQKDWAEGAEPEELGITRRSVLYLFLISTKESLIKSPWNEYSQSLPTQFPSPFHWEKEALAIQTNEVQTEVSACSPSRHTVCDARVTPRRFARYYRTCKDSTTAFSPRFQRRILACSQPTFSLGSAGCGPIVRTHPAAFRPSCTQQTKLRQ